MNKVTVVTSLNELNAYGSEEARLNAKQAFRELKSIDRCISDETAANFNLWRSYNETGDSQVFLRPLTVNSDQLIRCNDVPSRFPAKVLSCQCSRHVSSLLCTVYKLYEKWRTVYIVR